jgi:hypothetical protein
MVSVGLRVMTEATAIICCLSLAHIDHQLARSLSDMLHSIAAMSVSTIFKVGIALQPDVATLSALIRLRTALSLLRSEPFLVLSSLLLIVLCDNYACMLLLIPWINAVSD